MQERHRILAICGSERIFVSSLSPQDSEEFFAMKGGHKNVFQGVIKMIFPRPANSREIFFCQLETKLKIF